MIKLNDQNRPRWQVFTSYNWRQGQLHGEYGLLSEADKAMQQLRDNRLIHKLHIFYLAKAFCLTSPIESINSCKCKI